jgi:hypothetical protein
MRVNAIGRRHRPDVGGPTPIVLGRSAGGRGTLPRARHPEDALGDYNLVRW